MMKIEMPIRKKGRHSKALIEENKKRKALFCEALIEIQSTLDFKISSRGWCYQLEDLAGLSKSDFDVAQNLINECRKNGMLPLNFTAHDEARALQGGSTYTDEETPEEYVKYQVEQIMGTYKHYNPKCLQDFHNYGIVVMVEKIDLVGLFAPVCERYNVPIFNARGWSDINSRGDLLVEMLKFLEQKKICLVLYCGDHDPAGLNISDMLPKNLKDVEQAVAVDSSLIRVERFGLDYDFIEQNHLSWIDNLDTSNPDTPSLDNPKHPDHTKPYVQDYLKRFGVRKCEANSLVVRHEAGRQLLTDTLSQYISDEQLFE
ncbi:MAG: hypothetical protein HQK62_09975 [Desulfamplus sp.]|nr:hypothetical protein [Desulfamplus sp.]